MMAHYSHYSAAPQHSALPPPQFLPSPARYSSLPPPPPSSLIASPPSSLSPARALSDTSTRATDATSSRHHNHHHHHHHHHHPYGVVDPPSSHDGFHSHSTPEPYVPIRPRTASQALYNKRCETCSMSHDGSFGAGRFCSSRCARTVGGLAHRKKRLLERESKQRQASQKRIQGKRLRTVASPTHSYLHPVDVTLHSSCARTTCAPSHHHTPTSYVRGAHVVSPIRRTSTSKRVTSTLNAHHHVSSTSSTSLTSSVMTISSLLNPSD